MPRVPGVQGRMPGRRRHGALQERIPGGLLDAPRRAVPRARPRARARSARWGSRLAPVSNWLARSSRHAGSTSGSSASIGAVRRHVGTADVPEHSSSERRLSPTAPTQVGPAIRSSTTPSRITTSPQSAWRVSRCSKPPARLPRWRQTAAAAGRSFHRGCSTRPAPEPKPIPTRCIRFIERGSRSCSSSRAACRPFARMSRRCFAVRRSDALGVAPSRCFSRICSNSDLDRGSASLSLAHGPATIVLHGHCHQKAMGLAAPAKALLARIPGASIIDLDAGCCGMAGSFGYTRDHFDVSAHRRAAAAPGGAEPGARRRARRQPARPAGTRSPISPGPGRCIRRSFFAASRTGDRMSLAVLSVCALAIAIIVSCFTTAQRRHSRDCAGVDHRRLHRRHAGQRRDERLPDPALSDADGRDAALCDGAVQRHPRPAGPPRGAESAAATAASIPIMFFVLGAGAGVDGARQHRDGGAARADGDGDGGARRHPAVPDGDHGRQRRQRRLAITVRADRHHRQRPDGAQRPARLRDCRSTSTTRARTRWSRSAAISCSAG